MEINDFLVKKKIWTAYKMHFGVKIANQMLTLNENHLKTNVSEGFPHF